ncbi:MAG: hypothetical protein EON87_01895 [Brevundimonas sp.]|jgi:hypothetical protein|nr:MAG: hypothetical protein EON87_01895 [Brevundimonas sp.]
MRYQATITVEFEAEDVYAERRHKACLTAFLAGLKEEYGEPALNVRARRNRLRPRAAAPAKLGPEVEIVRALYVG